jgi:hypothetical protein
VEVNAETYDLHVQPLSSNCLSPRTNGQLGAKLRLSNVETLMFIAREGHAAWSLLSVAF